MKVFISMPMKGKSKEQIKNDMESIKQQAKKTYPNAEFADSIIQENPPQKNSSVWYLSKSLEIMATCDVVVQPAKIDFFQNKGCYIERVTALAYGIKFEEINP